MDSSDDDTDSKSDHNKANKTDKASTESHRKEKKEKVNHNDTSDSDSGSDLSESEYVCSACKKKFSGYIPFKQHEKSNKHLKTLLKKKREKKLLDKIKNAEEESDNDEEYSLLIKKPYAECKPCGKQFGSPESYHLHIVSKTHKRNVLQASILDQVTENGEINVEKLKAIYKSRKTVDGNAENLLEDTEDEIVSPKVKDEDDDDDAGELECKKCQKSFSGMIPYTQHIMSKVHAKTVKRNKLLQKIVPEDVQNTAESNYDLSTLVIEDDILVCKLCSASFSGPESAMMHLKSRGHSKNLEKYLRKKERKMKAVAAARPENDSQSNSGKSSNNSSDTEDFNNESEKKNSEQTPSTSSKLTVDETGIPPLLENEDTVASSETNESLIAYSKYKKYKEIINSVRQDEKDA